MSGTASPKAPDGGVALEPAPRTLTTAQNKSEKLYSITELNAHYWPREKKVKDDNLKQVSSPAGDANSVQDDQGIKDVGVAPIAPNPTGDEGVKHELEQQADGGVPVKQPGNDVNEAQKQHGPSGADDVATTALPKEVGKRQYQKRGTINDSLEKPGKLKYVVLFSKAHPRWDTDKIIFCHSNLQLLPKPIVGDDLAEGESSKPVTTKPTVGKNPNPQSKHPQRRKYKMTQDVRQEQASEPLQVTEPQPPAQVFAEQLPSGVAVFLQVSQGYSDKFTRNMSFIGYHKIVRLEFLQPKSQELVRMLEQKWAATGGNPNDKRTKEKWNVSLNMEWAVIQMAIDEHAGDLAAPEITPMDIKPRNSDGDSHWPSRGRGSWRGRGRGGWRGRGDRGQGNRMQNPQGGSQEPSTTEKSNNGENTGLGVAEEQVEDKSTAAHQTSAPGQPTRQGGKWKGRGGGRGRFGRGYRGRGGHDSGKTVNELLAEARSTTAEVPPTAQPSSASATEKQENKVKKPLTSHQLRNQNSVSTHETWNRYASNIEEHDAKFKEDPHREIELFHMNFPRMSKEEKDAQVKAAKETRATYGERMQKLVERRTKAKAKEQQVKVEAVVQAEKLE